MERVARSGYGPASQEILREQVRHELTGQVGFALFDCPPAIVRGRGALVWDADGKEYVDMLAGFSVSNTGHCHPAVTAAVTEQAGLMHYFDLPGDQRERLAGRLAALAPGVRPRRVVFGTTGADAAELAIRLARWYTGAPLILSAYGGYHGTTGATMATTAKGGMWAFYYPVLPADSGHAKIPFSYPYRCPVGAAPEQCAEACLDFTRRMLLGKESPFTEHRAGVSNVAAVLLEPMQASAGYIIPGDGFLAGIRELCDEFGFLLIDDEIQAGMGRSGRMWACEHESVVPDMILVSKGLASGLPVSAVIADDEIAASWGPGAHVGTFSASALASAAANATLDVYESEHLVDRAFEVGGYFADQLRALQERHPILGWIDARGLFVGLEFVKDRATKEPAAEEAAWMLDFCVREGLLFEKGGYYYNRFQLIPSLVIEKDLIDRAVDILDRAMTMAEARSGISFT